MIKNLKETPNIVQNSSDMEAYQLGRYSNPERTVYLPSDDQMKKAIDYQKEKLELMLLEFSSDYETQPARIIRLAHNYWKNLWFAVSGIGNYLDYERRKDSIASHELAHHYISSMIPDMDVVYNALSNWNSSYSSFANKFRILRNYEELFSTLSEVHEVGEIGCLHLLIPDFVYKCWDGSTDYSKELSKLLQGEEIAGSYNLAAAIIIAGNLNPTVNKVNAGIKLYLEDPDTFLQQVKQKLLLNTIYDLIEKLSENLATSINTNAL